MGKMYSWLDRGARESVQDYDNRINQIPKFHAGYAFFHPVNYDDYQHVFAVYMVWNGELNSKLQDPMPGGGYQIHCSVKEAEALSHVWTGLPVFADVIAKDGRIYIREIMLDYNEKHYPLSYTGCEVYSPEELCFWSFGEVEAFMMPEPEKEENDGARNFSGFQKGSYEKHFWNGSFPKGSFWQGNLKGSFRNVTLQNGSFLRGSFQKSSFQNGSFHAGNFGTGSYRSAFYQGSYHNKFYIGSYSGGFGSYRREFYLGSYSGKLGSYRRGFGLGSYHRGSGVLFRNWNYELRTSYRGKNGLVGSGTQLGYQLPGSYRRGLPGYERGSFHGSYRKELLMIDEETADYLAFRQEYKKIQEIFGIGSLGYGLNLI